MDRSQRFYSPCRKRSYLPGALFLLIASMATLALAGIASAAPVATVQAASGTLSVKRSGTTALAALRVRSNLNIGDLVGTGANSKATLLFTNGSQLRMNANSAVEITAPSNVGRGKTSLFRAISGEVWARLRPGQAAQTRSAIAGVRGTEFILQIAADDTTTLTVIDGAVEFFNPFGEVVVGQSQQSVARVGSAPTAPLTIENAGLILEWTLDLDRALIPREKVFVSLDRPTVTTELAKRRAAAETQPDNAATQRAYGDSLFDAREFEQALVAYRNADRREQFNPGTLTRIGYTLLELGQFDEAEGSIQSALALAPDGVATAYTESALEKNQSTPLVGLAWLELARNRPVEAATAAERAVAAAPQLAEAQIVLGLSLMRKPGKLAEAEIAFTAAATAEPAALRYQAQAWLAMVRLSQDDREGALREAQAAVALAPNSGLARGNLSLTHFFTGNSREAEREARQAVALNPESVAALVALGQALLAQGDVGGADQAAAQAVALDPSLPQAHYLLGVAYASKRDYRHAARELQETLKLAPDFLPAASTLARVYNAQGRPGEAVNTLTPLLARHRSADAVQGALGEVYYEQGKYNESEQQYREALKLKPNSGLYHAELTRTLLYANRLNAAIVAGQEAVRLAPEVGQYHALLGLAYDFSGLTSQAERELREARTRDPQNALALAQLAYLHTGPDLRTAAVNFTQGFLIDPTISRQLLRGGVNAELTPLAGNDDRQDVNATHRLTFSEGRGHSFGFLGHNSADGVRANDDTARYDIAEFLTWMPGPQTNLYFNVRGRKANQGLRGSDLTPDIDDRSTFRFGQAQIAGRHRLGARSSVWLGVFGNTSRNVVDDPAVNSFFSAAGIPIDRERNETDSVLPELRFDYSLGRTPSRPSILSLGIGHSSFDFTSRQHQVVPGVAGGVDQVTTEDTNTSLAYVQLQHRVNNRLSITAQVRGQRSRQQIDTVATGVGVPPLAVSDSRNRTRVLPSFLATFQANPKTTLRLTANRRVTDTTPSLFAPAETLLTTEASPLPAGTPDTMNLYQLDIERYLSRRTFLKLFAFHTRANSVQLGGSDRFGFGGLPAPGAPVLFVGKWQATGAGGRLEHQLNRSLFANLGIVFRETDNQSNGPAFPRIFSGQAAPYEPERLISAGLNYVDPSGNKVGLGLRHVGSYFQDSPAGVGRPRFPSQTYFDLRLSRESSVRNELFFNVINLFDKPAIDFRDFAGGRRRVEVGATRRF